MNESEEHEKLRDFCMVLAFRAGHHPNCIRKEYKYEFNGSTHIFDVAVINPKTKDVIMAFEAGDISQNRKDHLKELRDKFPIIHIDYTFLNVVEETKMKHKEYEFIVAYLKDLMNSYPYFIRFADDYKDLGDIEQKRFYDKIKHRLINEVVNEVFNRIGNLYNNNLSERSEVMKLCGGLFKKAEWHEDNEDE